MRSNDTPSSLWAAVAAASYLSELHPSMAGFSPRNVRRMRDFYRLYSDMPELLNLLVSEAHLQISLDQTEKYWYNADNDRTLEFNQHEKDTFYMSRQYTNRARKPLIFLDFLKLTEKIYYLFTTY